MDTVGEWRRMKERLQKLIASAGLCARRTAEEWIAAGRVRVNGEVAVIGGRADPETDTVTVDGRPLPQTAAPVYLMLNKPRGYVTTLSDECGRQTAAELVAGCGARVYPVGRLDRDSEGLLLFTNDGDFAQRLLHPRHQVDKVYLVTVRGDIRGAAERLMAITELDGEPIAPAQAEEVSRSGGGPAARDHPSGQKPAGAPNVRQDRPACGAAAARTGGYPAAGRPSTRQVEILDRQGIAKYKRRRCL